MESHSDLNVKSYNPKEYKTENCKAFLNNQDEGIIDVVYEFLLKNGCFNTLELLQTEVLNGRNNMELYTRSNGKNTHFGEVLLLDVSYDDNLVI